MTIKYRLKTADKFITEALAGPPFDPEAMRHVRIAKELLFGSVVPNPLVRQAIVRRLYHAHALLGEDYAKVKIRLAIDALVA